MTQIKDYVLLIVGACLTCGGLTVLALSGQFTRIIHIIGSMFLLLCILSPLTGTFDRIIHYSADWNVPNSSRSESQVWDYSAQAMSSSVENTIQDYVVTVTGHTAKNIDVAISYGDNAFTITDIHIYLAPDDAYKSTALADYVAIKTGVRPVVISG